MKIAPAMWIAIVIAIAGAPFAHGEATSEQLPEVLERVKASVARQCAGHRATLDKADASSFSLEEARDGVEVTCICFPQELDEQSQRPHQVNETVERRAEAMARAAIEVCVLRRMRSRVPEACRQDAKKIPDPIAREAYCRCVESGVAKLTDQEVITSILRARESFDARVAALKKGDPAPPRASGPFESIESVCASSPP